MCICISQEFNFWFVCLSLKEPQAEQDNSKESVTLAQALIHPFCPMIITPQSIIPLMQDQHPNNAI